MCFLVSVYCYSITKYPFLAQFNTSEPMVEHYQFENCYPGFFGMNCLMRCNCDSSCTCDPVVGCSQCNPGKGCHSLYHEFPVCQGKFCVS